MIRVVIADDQRLVRDALRLTLESTGEIQVIGEAATGEEARQLARLMRPDVVLMDVSMPGGGGVEATRRLMSTEPPLAVLGVSQFARGPYVERFLRAGGIGYVSKHAGREELLTAVRKACVGVGHVSAEVSVAEAREPAALSFGIGPRLTRRELQVLAQLASGRTVADIADALYLSIKTVAHHRRQLLAKFGVSNDVQLVNEARAAALVDEGVSIVQRSGDASLK